MSGSFQRGDFTTTDPEEGHAWLRQMYTDFDVDICGSEDSFRLTSQVLHVGTLTISTIQHTMAVAIFARDGLDWQGIFQSRLPTVDVNVQHHQHRLDANTALSMSPHVPYRVAWHNLDSQVVALDPSVVDDIAAQLTGNPRHVGFDFAAPISPVAAGQWRQTFALVERVALANTANPDGALLANELTRLLTTTALNCFPNSAMPDRDTRPTRTSPESLRRAVAYIDARLDEPIRLADLAAAAGVSPRALNLTFNRHHDTSPIGYIRRARLDAAHRDLQAAQPGDGQSVTSIAARWGFYSLPRFGVTYRRAYGQPPSRTLRRAVGSS